MFVTQGPVNPNSRLFIGRETELNKMGSWLTSVACVGAVCGARQTGKTSLLLKLRQSFREKYAFVFIDLQVIEGAAADQCFSYIAGETLCQLAELATDIKLPQPLDSSEFLLFLQALSKQLRAVRVIILLDEVGALPSHTGIKLAHTIRAAFTNRIIKQELARYTFILAGATDMLELATSKNSPLKNVTESVYLPDLSLAETELLLLAGFEASSPQLPPYLSQHIYKWSGGHPYWTQLLGASLEDSLQGNVEEVISARIEEMLQTEDKNLPHVLRFLEDNEQLWNIVTSLCEGRSISFSRSSRPIARLELIGIIKNAGGYCAFRNNIYRQAVQRLIEQDQRVRNQQVSNNQSTKRFSDIQDGGELAIGSVLAGRYLIESELGRGGIGVVYLARDQTLVNKSVVVKVLLDKSLRNEWVLKKFQHEKEALSRVDHPGIIGILDAGETPCGIPYLVMQYAEGTNLRDQMQPGKGMKLERAGEIIRQIGEALAAAHAQGILHRDLKPENIMRWYDTSGHEHVKIIDFGIAKVRESWLTSSTPIAMTVGTYAYMSPEQFDGESSDLTPASDLYTLGLIAFEMVTGLHPFPNPASLIDLRRMQGGGVKVRPRDLRPDLSLVAQELICKALLPKPAERHQKTNEFGEALWRALHETHKEPLALEKDLGHVLFMDIVGYSKLMTDEQKRLLGELQSVVRATREFKKAEAVNKLIRLPTGDGMALVFLHDMEAPINCAIEISKALKSSTGIQLRMGVNSGPIEIIEDINNKVNVAGAGINMAQRVMDCGDAGHILLSKRVAEDLGQYSNWQAMLHDLGEAVVKHNVRAHVYSLYSDDVGNQALPNKLRKQTLLQRVFSRLASAGR